MTRFEEIELGEIAYNEYCDYVGWVSINGDELPKFHNQKENIKNGWVKAALGVMYEIERKRKIEENKWSVDLTQKTPDNFKSTKIIKNIIKCNFCNDVIESKHRHDFVSCKCGRVSVDGGKDYFKRSFKEPTDYEEMSISEDI